MNRVSKGKPKGNGIYFHCFLMEIFFSESFCITCKQTKNNNIQNQENMTVLHSFLQPPIIKHFYCSFKKSKSSHYEIIKEHDHYSMGFFYNHHHKPRLANQFCNTQHQVRLYGSIMSIFFKKKFKKTRVDLTGVVLCLPTEHYLSYMLILYCSAI